MPYQIRTQRGEVGRFVEVDYPRSDAMDQGARAIAAAFEADTANDTSYGNQPVTSSITYYTTTTITDTVPLTV